MYKFLILFCLVILVPDLFANDLTKSSDVPSIAYMKKRADAYWKSMGGNVDYLPLSGGSLTGSLYGTSASFSGIIYANATSANIRLYGDGTGLGDGFIGAGNDGTLYMRNWDGTRGFVIKPSGDAYFQGGRFGIGTNEPSYKLEAVTTGKLGFRLQTNESTVGNPQLDFLDVQRNQETVISSTDGVITGTYLASYSNHPLMFGTNHSSSQMLLATNGNLGIGTTSPVSKLHVNGDITVASGSRVVYDPLYDVHGYTKYDYVGLSEAALLTYSYYGNRFQTRNGIAMVIKGDNNNIGIGTISPSYKLETVTSGQGGFRLQTSSSTVGNPQIDLFDASKGQETVISSTDGSITGTYLASYSNHPLMFGTNHSSAQILLATNGNLGVGTTSPSEKLSVNGNVKAKKIIVSQTGWPDYVFAPSYSLRSLSEVEKFITKNKHLPDMPSAKEVEEKGINVGDNQALLLKKVEELTLYIIDLQKQINQLKQNSKK
jgi:hypothetical protein